jgi:hypothetical protein
LPPGSIVTDQGIILPLRRSPFETFLYNWQTLITGGLAIIAAIIGASAAYHVGSAQMAAAKRKDRLQAQCIAVAISPELLNLKVRYERASKIIGEEFPKAKRPGMMTDGVELLHSFAMHRLKFRLSSTEVLTNFISSMKRGRPYCNSLALCSSTMI